MNRLYPRAWHRIGLMQGEGRAGFAQRIHDEAIFVEAELAAGCGGRDIGGMVNNVQHDLFRYGRLNDGGFALSGPV